jgi:hypothetical protein
MASGERHSGAAGRIGASRRVVGCLMSFMSEKALARQSNTRALVADSLLCSTNLRRLRSAVYHRLPASPHGTCPSCFPVGGVCRRHRRGPPSLWIGIRPAARTRPQSPARGASLLGQGRLRFVPEAPRQAVFGHIPCPGASANPRVGLAVWGNPPPLKPRRRSASRTAFVAGHPAPADPPCSRGSAVTPPQRRLRPLARDGPPAVLRQRLEK